MGYILFGAGVYGKKAIIQLGHSNIDYFIDNKCEKREIEGISIYHYSEVKGKIKDCRIVISVSEQYRKEIKNQLDNDGIENISIDELLLELARERLLKRNNTINIYRKAINWIYSNTINESGIAVSNNVRIIYPEVTGYYIPTLLKWGYKDLAIKYAKELIRIQKKDGSWYDSTDQAPYIFDSAQILKGLLAIRNIMPEVDDSIVKGCNWIISCISESGKLITPTKNAWGEDKSFCDEKVHIYCLSPLMEAGEIFNKPNYLTEAKKIWNYYKENYYDEILNFSLLSHFYAYLMEALLDLGEVDMARTAMNNISQYQKETGAVPALNNVDWVCSTGLFQLALVWFRLGDIDRGNKAFTYACKLQNESGGWFGSYLSEENVNEDNIYFPNSEISWAVKYFLDALYYKNQAEFKLQSSIFLSEIRLDDDRYIKVKKEIKEIKGEKPLKILDVGCGKGRYIKNLISEMPDNKYYGVDISEDVMKYIDNSEVICKAGTLTQIPYENDEFDCVYSCEALEHAIDIESSLNEMARVTKKNGKIIIVDKNKDKLGTMEIEEWEQWFDENELVEVMKNHCSEVSVHRNINYEGNAADGLFLIWVGKVK